MDTYILEGREIVRCSDIKEWNKWMTVNRDKRHVADEMIGNSRISTVFLGIDHSFGGSTPILFETMVFGGSFDQLQDRCSTWDEAEQMHLRTVELVRNA